MTQRRTSLLRAYGVRFSLQSQALVFTTTELHVQMIYYIRSTAALMYVCYMTNTLLSAVYS